MEITDLVYIAFSKYVIALDRTTGTIRWEWKIPKGRNYPALLVDGSQIFVAAMGYTYCLDAYTGRMIWENPLTGYGTGVACIATANSQTNPARAAAQVITQQQASGAAS